MNPFDIVKAFERELCDYTGAPYCVAVNSCTNALFLAAKYYHKSTGLHTYWNTTIQIPRFTYVSVPMQIKHAGYDVRFRDEEWLGMYDLFPLNIWDSARWLTSGMYLKKIRETERTHLNDPMLYPKREPMICLSFHWSKTLGVQQGGAILHCDTQFDQWARRARFDGRTEGIYPKDDKFDMLGYHMYMSPEIAAEGLVRLRFLPQENKPLPNDDYPDLSKMELFHG